VQNPAEAWRLLAGVGRGSGSARPRSLRRIHQPVLSPSLAQQPRARRCDRPRRWILARRRRAFPSIEPRPGRRRVESNGRRGSGSLPPVLACVQEHVGQGIPHFPSRPEHVEVVAAEQDRPLPSEHTVHGSRKTRHHRLHPARQRLVPCGPPPPGAGGRVGSSTGRRGTRRARRPRASWPGIPTRTGDCAARVRRDAPATSHAKDSAEIGSVASRDESAGATTWACARRPDGTRRESGTPELVVSRCHAQS